LFARIFANEINAKFFWVLKYNDDISVLIDFTILIFYFCTIHYCAFMVYIIWWFHIFMLLCMKLFSICLGTFLIVLVVFISDWFLFYYLLQKCVYHNDNIDKIWVYCNKIQRSWRKKYVCGNQKIMIFELYNTKFARCSRLSSCNCTLEGWFHPCNKCNFSCDKTKSIWSGEIWWSAATIATQLLLKESEDEINQGKKGIKFHWSTTASVTWEEQGQLLLNK